MPPITARSPGASVLLLLAKELPVHGDEQLLAVLSETCVAPNGLDYVKGGLIVAACDRKVAEKARQRAWLQLQGALKIRDLGGDRQRATVLPLRDSGLAHTSGAAK